MAKVGYEIAKNINAGLTLDLHENWPAYLRMATHVKSLLGRFLSNNNQWIKYEKSFCEKADNIIVVVDEAKVRLINIGIDPEKIKVVSNTINLNNIDSLNTIPDNDYFTLFYAGGITKHRGLQFIIPALNKVKLKDKKLRFWVLGTGNYIDNLKQLAREIGVEENIEFFGWKPFNEMMKYLGKSDVCIIPHTKSDHTDTTIPHKLFQYMYFNKPIIASNCDPIERIIEETKCGLVYTHDSENDFADKLKILAENNKVNTTGKKAVADKYNWEKDSETLISIYK
ncbi:MAG: hypothetical protein B6D61_12805 [Bacteroidetes bacterium 4484_249]|nr:MAG: hypothetical protein B6D61_12805 [Bacteroidetes bacterium 4484_249]